MNKSLFITVFLLTMLISLNAIVVVQWNFEAQTITPSTGNGNLSLLGGVTTDSYAAGYGDNYGWVTTTYPVQGTNNNTAGVELDFSTVGFTDISFSWNHRHSNTSANRVSVYYTANRSAASVQWILATTFDATNGDIWFQRTFDFSSIRAFSQNPNLAIKLVASFSDAANTLYMPSKTTSTYAPSGKWRFDDLTISGTATVPNISCVGSFSTFFAEPGQVSDIQTYSLTGSNLTSDLVITASEYYKIKTQSQSVFVSVLNITPDLGGIADSIQVRFEPLIAGDYPGTITHNSTGASGVVLNVTGSTVKPEPTADFTGLSVTNITYYSCELNWTDAMSGITPDGYLITGSRTGFDDVVTPVDGVSETDGISVLNVDQGIGHGSFQKIRENVTYYFKVFPYSNSGVNINYKTDSPVQFTVTTLTGPVGSILQPGDIAFTEYGADSPDRYGFVLMRDIRENTKIKITDNAWDGTALLTTEGTVTWRAVGRAYLAGETVRVVEGLHLSVNGVSEPGFEGFSNSGDQILAYQGDDTNPQFIAGLSTTGWINTGSPTSNTSYLPASLTAGVNTLGFSSETDNGYYGGILNTGSASQVRTALCTPANWIRSNSLTGFSYPDFVYNISENPVTGTAITLNGNNLMLSWDAFPGAVYYNVYYSTQPDNNGVRSWQLLQSNLSGTSLSIPASGTGYEHKFYIVTAFQN